MNMPIKKILAVLAIVMGIDAHAMVTQKETDEAVAQFYRSFLTRLYPLLVSPDEAFSSEKTIEFKRLSFEELMRAEKTKEGLSQLIQDANQWITDQVDFWHSLHAKSALNVHKFS